MNPLYAFVRHRGHPPEDAKDLTQAFFDRFLEKRFLKDVAPERGRFRTFLLRAVTHFLANERDRTKAAKRGGECALVDLNSAALEERYGADASSEESPERHFDRRWAAAVMDHALGTLKAECGQAGKVAQFEALAKFLSCPPSEGEYAKVSDRLGMNSHAVAVAVARLRERYRALVRAEIARTVDDPADIDGELRYLVELLAE